MTPSSPKSPSSVPKLLIVATLTAVALALQVGPSAAGARTSPAAITRAKQRAVQRLMPMAQGAGRLRVLIQLEVNFRPEGQLRGWFPQAMQREAIRRVQQQLASRLPASRGQVMRNYRAVPLLLLEVTAEGLADLVSNPLVTYIQLDEAVPPILDGSIPLIGADQAWGLGYAGAGQAVAVLDTGVDSAHEFLAGKVIAEACFSTNYVPLGATSLCPSGFETEVGPGAGEPCDAGIFGCDHGTHVAGIAAGKGASFSGVGRDADLIAVQVFSRFEGTTCTDYGLPSPCALTFTSDQISALEWVYDQAASYSIASANMSLGGGQYTAACDTDGRKSAIDQLRSVDIATVIAAGNNAFKDALAAPGCISTAVSVGSTTLSDTISGFSNVATFLDLLAPGSSIYSSVPGDAYANFSGTSMAAPHVAGAWAVLKSKNPAATVDQVLAALASTGVLIDDTRTGGTVTDLPRIQVDQAVQTLSGPPPTATASPTGSATWTPTTAPTPTETPAPTESVTPEPSATPSPLPPSATPTATRTLAPSSTPLPPPETPDPTDTPTATATPSPSPTATATLAAPTATSSPAASASPTSTPSSAPSPTPSPSSTLTPTASSTPTSTPMPGDINMDGTIDVLDVQLVVNVFLGTETDPGIVSRADVNTDGEVNVLDVQLVVNLFLGV